MRILWLKTELLHPLDKGGRIRSYHMLRALAAQHEVEYLALDDGSATTEHQAQAREYCHRLQLMPIRLPRRRSASFLASVVGSLASRLPFAVGRYASDAFARAGREAASRADVVVCDFLAPAVNVGPELRRRSILFQHNVEAEIWRRHADVAGSAVTRALYRDQFRRMARFEAEACRQFGHVVAVSEKDEHHFRAVYGATRVSAVATGVDCDFFQPRDASLREPDHLVFLGSMDWMPNEDGMQFFCDAVLPRIRAQRPDTRLSIVGRHPSPRIRALAERAGVSVTGTVDDVRPYLARAAIVLVPLRVGGGTRLKIYEALAMDCPVVSTSIGMEGLPLTPGVHVAVADDVEEFARACLALMGDRHAAAALGARGGALVRERFGWSNVARDFLRVCEIADGPTASALGKGA